jgi:UDP-N-acetylmuramoyl-tripeptide--D-alanyl-D-alanine ligase
MPTYGLITNCGKAHPEVLQPGRCKKGQGELFDHLRTLTHGVVFVSGTMTISEMSKGISGIIKYGTTEDSHIIGKVNKVNLTWKAITQGLDNGP